jgi:acyl-CoA oxidase
MLGQSATIATRYSIVRVQGATDEQRLINFPIHQSRVLPSISLVYLCSFTGKNYMRRWDQVLSNLRKLSEGQNDHLAPQVLAQVADMHAISAGTKCWLGWMAGDWIETLRRCLGGHGYSAYNALGAISGDYAVMMTGGGDNIVLAQQNARFLLNSVKKAFLGKSLSPCVAYFADIPALSGQTPAIDTTTFPPTTIEGQISTIQTLVKFMMLRTSERIQAKMSHVKDQLSVWNSFVGELLPISRMWTFAETLSVFLDEVKHQSLSSQVKLALLELIGYWGLVVISDNFELFLTYGIVSASPDLKEKLEEEKNKFCEKIRNNAIGFVDALSLPDWLIKAPIGAYDGKIYSKYFQTVVEAPNSLGVPHYWKQHIKPLTQLPSKL